MTRNEQTTGTPIGSWIAMSASDVLVRDEAVKQAQVLVLEELEGRETPPDPLDLARVLAQLNLLNALGLAAMMIERVWDDTHDAVIDAETADEELREVRAASWALGQSLGPWVHGLPEEECRRIEALRDQYLREGINDEEATP